MPEMNFEAMLEELSEQYPQIKEQALELKDDVMDLMGGESMDEVPELEPELDELALEDDEEEDELELEL